MVKYKNIIFDLGGVMFAWPPEKLPHEAEIPPEFFEVVHSPLWLAHDGGFVTRREVIEKAPPFVDRPLFTTFLNSLAKRMRPVEEMHSIFREAKAEGYLVYILSNMPRELHLELSDLHSFFQEADGAVYSYQVGSIKPMEKIYKALLSTYQLKPEECLFIDDLELNIRAAKQLGIDGVVCKDPAHVRQELQNLKVLG